MFNLVFTTENHWYILNLFVIYLCNSTFFYVMDCKHRPKKYLFKFWLTIALLCGVINAIVHPYSDGFWFPFFYFITAILVYYCGYTWISGIPKGKSVFIFLLYISAFLLIYTLSLAMDLAMGSQSGHGWVSVFRIALYGLLLWLYQKYGRDSFERITGGGYRGWAGVNAVSGVFIIMQTVAIIIYGKNFNGQLQLSQLIAVFSAFFLCILVLCVIFHNVSLTQQAMEVKHLQIQEKALQSQIQDLLAADMLAKRLRHDLRHHNAIISRFAKNGQLEQLLAYLGDYESELDEAQNQRYCANEIANHILNFFAQKAEAQGILFQCKAILEADTAFAQRDIVSILCNLLENALNGCREEPMPYIDFSMHPKGCKLVIVCKNSCSKEIVFRQGIPSSKSGHGIGTKSILMCVKRYNGDIMFQHQQQVFSAKLVLHIAD